VLPVIISITAVQITARLLCISDVLSINQFLLDCALKIFSLFGCYCDIRLSPTNNTYTH